MNTMIYLLIDAVREGNSSKIIELLQKGVDPNGKVDKDGLTPLCFAITRKQVTAIKLLLAAGADIHAYIPGHECTVLEYVEQSNDVDMIELLLQSEKKEIKISINNQLAHNICRIFYPLIMHTIFKLYSLTFPNSFTKLNFIKK